MRTPSSFHRVSVAATISVALLLGTVACSSGQDSSTSQSATTLDVTAFGERVAQEGMVVLDVRTPGEFAGGHLPDAVNVDLESGAFAQQIATMDPDLPYAVYCRSGNRSGQALTIMQDAGFTDLAHLDGGIVDWAQAGGVVIVD